MRKTFEKNTHLLFELSHFQLISSKKYKNNQPPSQYQVIFHWFAKSEILPWKCLLFGAFLHTMAARVDDRVYDILTKRSRQRISLQAPQRWHPSLIIPLVNWGGRILHVTRRAPILSSHIGLFHTTRCRDALQQTVKWKMDVAPNTELTVQRWVTECLWHLTNGVYSTPTIVLVFSSTRHLHINGGWILYE